MFSLACLILFEISLNSGLFMSPNSPDLILSAAPALFLPSSPAVPSCFTKLCVPTVLFAPGTAFAAAFRIPAVPSTFWSAAVFRLLKIPAFGDVVPLPDSPSPLKRSEGTDEETTVFLPFFI